MDIIAILSTVILLATAGTIMVAVAAYIAFKVRERRKPSHQRPPGEGARPGSAPIFLTRYLPPGAGVPDAGLSKGLTRPP